jgi:hypothetical protein
LRRFAEAFAPCGFRAEAFFPAYGLAEATLIVTGGQVGHLPASSAFDAAAMEHSQAYQRKEHSAPSFPPGASAKIIVRLSKRKIRRLLTHEGALLRAGAFLFRLIELLDALKDFLLLACYASALRRRGSAGLIVVPGIRRFVKKNHGNVI